VVSMEAGAQATATEVITGDGFAAVTTTVADPVLLASSADVAVIVAVPAASGVKTPAPLIVPTFAGLTAQLTAEL